MAEAPTDEVAPQDGTARARIGRRGRIAIAVLLVLLVALAALWAQRRPIAASVVDAELRKRGVAARYRIEELGFGRQRLTNVVLGDSARPDLVADWVELDTRLSLSGARVVGMRAGRVQMRARLADGIVSFGAIDRLLPPPSGKPFSLPAIDLDVADGRLRLETPYGLVALKLAGRGLLADGFRGTLAAATDRLELGACRTGRGTASLMLHMQDSRPSLKGPVRAQAIDCGDVSATAATLDVDAVLTPALTGWQGGGGISVASVDHPRGRIERLAGRITGGGTWTKSAGLVDLTAGRATVNEGRAAGLSARGRYMLAGADLDFNGAIGARHVGFDRIAAPWLRAVGAAGAGTPVAPLGDRIAAAGRRAARDFAATADVALALKDGAARLTVQHARMVAASGAAAQFDGGDGIRIDTASAAIGLDGEVSIGGGGLPSATLRIAQTAPGQALRGTGSMARFVAGDAGLALGDIRFTAAPGGRTRFATHATLSGPMAGGRIDGASLPIEGIWDQGGRLSINRGCAPLRFDRLAVAGLVVARSSVRVCPLGDAIVAIDRGRVRGGARIANLRLAGMIGSAPATIAAGGAQVRIEDASFAVDRIAVRIGTPKRQSQLDVAGLTGGVQRGAVSGKFTDASGRIGAVPLLMSGAGGEWRFADERLTITGGLTLADADANPRFHPLKSDAVRLTLAGSRIAATAPLVNPATGAFITDVTIDHDLASGAGHAVLDLPGIAFGPTLQPDQLTRLTYGVIADVVGTVSGRGDIRWTADGVTSEGVFRTPGTDLATAFGPVTGIVTEIRFSDLLGMVSAPDQMATVATINPGIAVENGVVRYALLGPDRVAVSGALWPFAGGELRLEPSILDFAEARQRRLTFKVRGMDAAQFLQQFDFKNLNATGSFDGTLPMVFDQSGGRINDGRLTVREGGGSVAYVGELSQEDLGFWGNTAFQALKSLKYRNLDIVMNGPLAGEMITEVRFAGISQGEGTKSNFVIRRLAKLPFVFNVRIAAPFRQLIDSAQSFYDPRRLIERNLPALIRAQEERDKSIQPPESEKRP